MAKACVNMHPILRVTMQHKYNYEGMSRAHLWVLSSFSYTPICGIQYHLWLGLHPCEQTWIHLPEIMSITLSHSASKYFGIGWFTSPALIHLAACTSVYVCSSTLPLIFMYVATMFQFFLIRVDKFPWLNLRYRKSIRNHIHCVVTAYGAAYNYIIYVYGNVKISPNAFHRGFVYH